MTRTNNIIKKHWYKVKDIGPSRAITIGFLLLILIGALLLKLPIATASGESTSLLNAFFTSGSSICVTGLFLVDTASYWSTFGKIVIAVLIQIGGLGFMSVGTIIFLIIGKKISLKNQLITQSSLSINTPKGILKFVENLIIFTLIIEGIGALILSFTFIPEFGVGKGILYSIFHSLSAFCNAGVDLIGNSQSFTPYATNILVNITMMILIILGGLGFGVIMDVIKTRKFSKFALQTKLVLSITAILVVVGAALFFLFEVRNPETIGNFSSFDKVLTSFFTSVTTRTAGFFTVDMTALTPESKFLTILLMFVGAAPGSTAGGIKIITAGVAFIVTVNIVRGKTETEIFKRRISDYTSKKAFAITMLAILWVIITTILITINEPNIHISSILFDVISCLTTTGLDMNIINKLSSFSQILLLITMFFGRIGLITITFAIARRKSEQSAGLYSYPEGDIIL